MTDELDRKPGDFPDDDMPQAEGYDGPEGFDDPEAPQGQPQGQGHGEAGAPEAEAEAQEDRTDWEEEAAIYKEKFLRALADNENSRRRQEKELSAARKYSSETIFRDLILVLDNLHLALSYADPNDPAVKGLAEGVSMTVIDCLNKMSDHGFKELKCSPGDVVDPNFHEVVGMEPSDSLPDNTVSKVIQRGYLLHDRLLRPAKVIQVKNPA
jgi:molecular chaperone GrpE